MDARAVGELVALLGHLVLQVGQVLVVVGVQRAVIQRGVGEHVVVELLDLQFDAGVLGEIVADVLEDLRVWHGTGADRHLRGAGVA